MEKQLYTYITELQIFLFIGFKKISVHISQKMMF